MEKEPGEARKKLLELQATGKYVFHGTDGIISTLEPRQAHTYNEVTGEHEKDGAPAVFATPYADAAIFRVLIHPKNVDGNSDSSFGTTDEGLYMKASQNLLDAAKDITGRVYILDKASFIPVGGTNYKSIETITPLGIIEVKHDDLPPQIVSL